MQEVNIINQQEVLGKVFTVYGDFQNPLFLAKDVAEMIEHSDVHKMVQIVDEDEKVRNTVPTLGGNQESWFLTENGLYEILMISRKPIAKQFKKEVKRILHELRTGNAVIVPKTFSEALYLAAKQQEQLEQQQKLLLEQQPKVETYDRIADSSGLKSIQEVAGLLGYGWKKYFGILRGLGILYKTNDTNLPKKELIDKGYFVVKEEPYRRDNKDFLYTRIFVTAKGLLWLEKQTPKAA